MPYCLPSTIAGEQGWIIWIMMLLMNQSRGLFIVLKDQVLGVTIVLTATLLLGLAMAVAALACLEGK